MIKNERQYLISKKAAQGLHDTLIELHVNQPEAADPKKHAWKVSGIESQLTTLNEEIRLYEQLQDAKGRRAIGGSIEHLAALLIQARIARGWSQRQLAERLGLQMQKVQQYEATDYAGASLTRLLEVCQALGVTGRLELKLVELPDVADLATPRRRSNVVPVAPIDMRRMATVKKVRKQGASVFRVQGQKVAAKVHTPAKVSGGMRPRVGRRK